MAISKSAKIQAEIEKVTAKINEQQARPTPGAVRNGTALILWSRRPWKPLTPARASPRTATL